LLFVLDHTQGQSHASRFPLTCQLIKLFAWIGKGKPAASETSAGGGAGRLAPSRTIRIPPGTLVTIRHVRGGRRGSGNKRIEDGDGRGGGDTDPCRNALAAGPAQTDSV
jgi:hypothetical protein